MKFFWIFISIYIIIFAHWQNLNIGIDRVQYGFPIDRFFRPIYFISPILLIILFKNKLFISVYLKSYLLFIFISLFFILFSYQYISLATVIAYSYLVFNILLFYMIYYSFKYANISIEKILKYLSYSMYITFFIGILNGILIFLLSGNNFYLVRMEGVIPEANILALWFAMVFFIFYTQKGYKLSTAISFLGILATTSRRVFLVVSFILVLDLIIKIFNQILNGKFRIAKSSIYFISIFIILVIIYIQNVEVNIFSRISYWMDAQSTFGEGKHMFYDILNITKGLYGFGIGFLKEMHFTETSSKVYFFASYQDLIASTGFIGLIVYLSFKLLIILRAYKIFNLYQNHLKYFALSVVYYVISELILGLNTTFWSLFNLFFLLGVFEYMIYKVKKDEHTIYSK